MRKYSAAQLKNEIDDLLKKQEKLRNLFEKQEHERHLFSLISTVAGGDNKCDIEYIVRKTEYIPNETQIDLAHGKWWRKSLSNKTNKTIEQLKEIEEKIKWAEREYSKVTITANGRKENRKVLIGLVFVVFVILLGVLSKNSWIQQMLPVNDSTYGKLKKIRKYTVNVQEDENNYIQLNSKNHVQWEDGENTIVEFFLDWLHGEEISGKYGKSEKYGKADNIDRGWSDNGNGWETLEYTDRFKFLGEISNVKWDVGIADYDQYYFKSYSWITDARYFSDGFFECAVYVMNDLWDEEIKEYDIYMRNNSIKEYTATWNKFTLECDAYSSVVQWTIKLNDE